MNKRDRSNGAWVSHWLGDSAHGPLDPRQLTRGAEPILPERARQPRAGLRPGLVGAGLEELVNALGQVQVQVAEAAEIVGG